MRLYIRISNTDLHFALKPTDGAEPLRFEQYHLRPQVSLTVNLREAMQQLSLQLADPQEVVVYVSRAVTPVPLSAFQEEDVTDTLDFCFTSGEQCRTFYDVVPAANVVLLFSLGDVACRTLEEAFGEVKYVAALTPLLQHFATESATTGLRMLIYPHDGIIDLLVVDGQKLLMQVAYPVKALTDVTYYAFNLARHLHLDVEQMNLFVAGRPDLRDPVVTELKKYAPKVFAIYPAATFCRHAVSMNNDIPFDMMCGLMATKAF